LAAAERLSARPDLDANLEPTDRAYLAACGKAEARAKRGKRLLLTGLYVLLICIIGGLVAWIKQGYIKNEVNWVWTMHPYMRAQVQPYVLKSEG
jgi:hypothetical protein